MATEDLLTPFAFLDLDRFLAHPKAAKPEDRRRILRSADSEDWVTWNVVEQLRIRTDWWPAVVGLAEKHAWALADSLALGDPPSVDLWRQVPSPRAYERASRKRMADSNDADWRNRAANRRPVEGPTEVDIVFEGPRFLIFVEAKLRSDMSMRTTYDPSRNQIERNIDCVLENAGNRDALFWMFVKERQGEFEYTKLVEAYRSDIGRLQSRLPHRDPKLLARLVENIALVEWRELSPLLPDIPELADVRAEICRRVG